MTKPKSRRIRLVTTPDDLLARKLVAGTVVELASGGIAMTIESVVDCIASCIWTDSYGKIRREKLPVATLRLNTEQKKPTENLVVEDCFGNDEAYHATPDEILDYRHEVVTPRARHH